MHGEFMIWYNRVKHETFDFKKEFKLYCLADVELLSRAILKYREIFRTNRDLDPFRYVTLPSMCKDMYINKDMPEGKIVGNGSNKPISQICKEWLIHIEAENVVPEVPITVNNIPDAEYFVMFGGKQKDIIKENVTPSQLTLTTRQPKPSKSFRAVTFTDAPSAGLN